MGMIGEDRKQTGLLLSQSIRDNTTLGSLGRLFSRFGIIRKAAEMAAVLRCAEQLETKYQHPLQAAQTLSGGNQQKIIVARWLLRNVSVLLCDEPTRGIDVAARRRIYQVFAQLAEQGKALVIVSSDVEELMAICDRICVLSNGRLVQTFTRGSWSRADLMLASFAGYKQKQSA
jgi:ribose transport system ATP-binding protein